MKIVNLTPHAINCVDRQGNPLATYPASGQVARVESDLTEAGSLGQVGLFRQTLGEVTDLPEQEPETIFIVSGMVRSALPARTDLASPGDLVRDAEGRPVGCKGLVVN